METTDGEFAGVGIRDAGSITELRVRGRAGASDADAVVLNVAVTGAAAPGFVTVWPCGESQPNASSLNHDAGQTISNSVTAKVGSNGAVCLFVLSTTHVIVDLAGAFPTGAGYSPLVPSRVIETRAGMNTVDGQAAGERDPQRRIRDRAPGRRTGGRRCRRRSRAQRCGDGIVRPRLRDDLPVRGCTADCVEPQLRRRTDHLERSDRQGWSGRHDLHLRHGRHPRRRRRRRILPGIGGRRSGAHDDHGSGDHERSCAPGGARQRGRARVSRRCTPTPRVVDGPTQSGSSGR